MLKRTKNRLKAINNDTWLTKNFERIVNKYQGRYILIGAGKVLFTDDDGTPRELLKKAKTKYPGVTLLFFRVPSPHEFLCALAVP